MTPAIGPRWETKRTPETRQVEAALRQAGFEQVDAYRYNSASIRVRVIDKRFESLSPEARDALVEPHFEQLDERTQADILSFFTFSPSEMNQPAGTFREYLNIVEFEDPSPSML